MGAGIVTVSETVLLVRTFHIRRVPLSGGIVPLSLMAPIKPRYGHHPLGESLAPVLFPVVEKPLYSSNRPSVVFCFGFRGSSSFQVSASDKASHVSSPVR